MNEELKAVRTRLDRSLDLEDEEARNLLRPITDALLDLGASRAEVVYSGCGDDGEIESAAFYPESVEVPEELRQLVEDWAWAVLPEGWESDDGSQGTVTIEVADSTARIDHEWNINSTESETYEIGEGHAPA